jgi:hypothetical protein
VTVDLASVFLTVGLGLALPAGATTFFFIGDGGGSRASYGRGRGRLGRCEVASDERRLEGVHGGARGRGEAGGGEEAENYTEAMMSAGNGEKRGLIFLLAKWLVYMHGTFRSAVQPSFLQVGAKCLPTPLKNLRIARVYRTWLFPFFH